jgi:ribonuclease HII
VFQPELAELRCDGRARTGYVERWARRQGLACLVGADEVGRGPLAGPVVGAAVCLPERHGIDGLDDSKRLTPEQRATLAGAIRARARALAVVEVCARDVDRVNILRAALRAMAAAVGRVAAQLGPDQRPDLVLVDGNATLPIALPQRTIVAGDHYSESVAAASILAKVHRDAVLTSYHRCWPHYGFDHNFGYGTAEHLAALRLHGPCPIHRLTFRGTTNGDVRKSTPVPGTLALL